VTPRSTDRPSKPSLSVAPANADAESHRLTGSALAPPLGMRDLLPPESRARRRVSEQLQAVFDRYGYELVTTPLFEHVEVFERGLTLDPRDPLRFVDPDTGHVCSLRPDITPQIARVVSTRLADYPPPWRMRYEGTVVRRRRGRARKQRQIAQVGVELIGLGGAEGDLEIIRLMSEACTSAGLADFRIELSEVGVGRALLGHHGDELLDQAAEALAHKDQHQLAGVLERAGVSASARERIAALSHLHGDVGVLKEAQKLLAGTPAEAHLAALTDVVQRLVAQGLGPKLGVDLGELRGAAYYTGVSFSLLAAGPGEAVASGGRYDALLGRYGAPQPATGAGIDLENLLWALDHAGLAWRDRSAIRVVVAGADGGVTALCDQLRAQGVPAAALPGASSERARDYARAWGYDAALLVSAQEIAVQRADGAEHKLSSTPDASQIEAALRWVRSSSKE
jgi:ATP phosphoribosyltransferase regulatory subunit